MWTCFSCYRRWCVGKRPANNWMQRSVCGIKPSLKADWWVWPAKLDNFFVWTLWPLFLLLSSHFFTSKNVLQWVMLQMCWAWNISQQIVFLFCLSSSNVSVKGDTRQRGRMAWKSRKHSRMQILQLKCKTHDFHTFSCLGLYILSSLPQDLRHCSTLSSSKTKLKKPFPSHSISTATNISTQFLLLSVCVYVCMCTYRSLSYMLKFIVFCVCVFVCFPYNTLCKLFW